MPETVAVTLPEMGESVTEGTVIEWRKSAGEPVSEGETLAEVTTDKVDVEVPSPASGVLSRIVAEAGSTVAVGSLIAEITLDGAGGAQPVPAATAASPAPEPPGGDPATAQAAPTPPTAGPQPAAAAPSSALIPAMGGAGDGASPLARRAAALAGIEVGGLRGTGPGGLVRTADVAAALLRGQGPDPAVASPGAEVSERSPSVAGGNGVAPAAPSAPQAPPAGSVQLRGPALALANAMDASREIPTATSFRTLEVDVLERSRRSLNDALRASGRTEKVSYTHLIGYAIARAAAAMPEMTAHFERTGDGQGVRVQPGVHLGLAVDTTRRDGSRFLVVPVIRDAAERDFLAFHSEYERLVGLARDGRLGVDDMRGASIQLTNPGGLGTVASVPRLTSPSGTIVATGSIDWPAGLRSTTSEALERLGVSKVMTLTSTYDHRVIQGAQSGEFLRRIEQLLAGGDRFYEEVAGALGVASPVTSGVAAAAATAAPSSGTGPPSSSGAPADIALLEAVSAGMSLVRGYRSFGHLAAHLDPLGLEPIGDQTMDEASLGLTPEIERRVPASVLRVYVPGETLEDVVPRLREVYCGTIAYEIEHLGSHEQRVWLREKIESGWHRRPLSRERRLVLLSRLTKVDAMERYFRRAFLGQKTFSIEGLDAMVPMLEELINLCAEDGIERVILGMAHRGRLATVTHVANRPYESILVTFEKGERKRQLGEEPNDPTGDVKYHLGADGTYTAENGRPVAIKILNNPSHLEIVDPVVTGWARAEQTRRTSGELVVDPRAAIPVLIHGDAAVTGQGVVAEVLNLQALTGYSVGGTVHVISNNQVGFTADPLEGRSTRYASDLAKGYDVPIIHVNADDVEACIHAMRLAHEYRRTFHRDVVVDLIGYRRFGHNETDEPNYTQPQMYARIREHRTARELYVDTLVAEGLLDVQEADQEFQAAFARVQAAHQKVKESLAVADEESAETHHGTDQSDLEIVTGVGSETLLGILRQLTLVPDGFTIHPKLSRQFDRRAQTVAEGEVDWATAESFAFGSLVLAGTPVRLTGQDTERGTFSQRHLVLHDAQDGTKYAPISHLVGAQAPFEIHNSPLSEEAAVGFEYGYAAAAPEALVLWEAQFGDFVNGAQVVIDQFIAAGAAKWGTNGRLVLLLPHGYEGQGPEHSSARLERFLQLSANGNMRVAYPSTAAQYFHLLRMQAMSPHPRPLVVMAPKSLLRSREAASPLDDLVGARFRPVIDDPTVDAMRREEVRTLLLCTGKMYHDLNTSPLRADAHKTAVARVEMLDPLPITEIISVIAGYPRLEQLFWVQEEPRNMGAWGHVSRPIGRMRPYDIRWDYIGRPWRASPSEGFHGAHAVEQERIVRQALTIEATTSEQALQLARHGANA